MNLLSVRTELSRSRESNLTAAGQFWAVVEIGERAVAAVSLALVLPVLVAAGTTTLLLSRRSPLIAHNRIGQGGRPIWVLKLRTMWPETGSRVGLVERVAAAANIDLTLSKAVHDPRITSRFAALCRRYSIDELPQLWNVVRGEMSLVGPRPLTAIEIETFYACDAVELLARKPGLSGLWQVRGRSRLSYRHRRRFDLFLIRNWSLALYLKVLAATIPAVLTGKDAW